MGEALDAAWARWTADGMSSAVLFALFSIAAVAWIASVVVVGVTAGRRWRSAYGWGLVAALPPVLVAACGAVWPASFPWWAAGGSLLGVLIAVLVVLSLSSAKVTCNVGHPLAPSWVHCPQCPPPAPPRVVPAVQPVAANSATMLPAGVAAGGAWSGGMGGMRGSPPSPALSGAGASAPAPRGPVLTRLISEAGRAGDHTVHASGALIGRNPQAEIVLDDQSASWDHARVIDRDGSPAIVDLGSSNGTFVNEERVETSLLIPGDRIHIGDTTFRVVTA